MSSTNTHKGIVIVEAGGVEEHEVPTPIPGRDEVLIEIKYSVVSASDALQAASKFQLMAHPYVIGIAGSGFIHSVGEGIVDLKAGDRVSRLPSFRKVS